MHHRSLGAAASRRSVAQDRVKWARTRSRSEWSWSICPVVMLKTRPLGLGTEPAGGNSRPASIVVAAKGLAASRGEPRRRRPRTAGVPTDVHARQLIRRPPGWPERVRRSPAPWHFRRAFRVTGSAVLAPVIQLVRRRPGAKPVVTTPVDHDRLSSIRWTNGSRDPQAAFSADIAVLVRVSRLASAESSPHSRLIPDSNQTLVF